LINLFALPYLSVAFWTALAVSGILAKPILATLLRLNSRQTVSAHAPEGHQKKQGTPTMGGLIVIAGMLAAMAVSGYRDYAAIVLLLGFALIGFIDDFVVPRKFVSKRGLGWRQKILMQLVVAVAAAMIARSSPLGIGSLAFMVLFFSNAYNFSDGLDALAGTILLGLASGLLAIGLLHEGLRMAWLIPLAAMLGAIVPFLFLNAPPARVFMGDVGSLPIGAVLGYVVGQFALGYGGGNDHVRVALGPLFVISLMMVIELVPVPLQILSVKLRKKRLFPYTPVHHAFEKAGWPETRVVFHFALAQLLLAALAVGLVVGLPAHTGNGSRPIVMR
jgi:phospho-N-acetylmuramoyl-pentapeptide-transferase